MAAANELVLMEFPMNGAIRTILFHVINKNPYSMEVVLSDLNAQLRTKEMPLTNQLPPAYYKSRWLGTMDRFLKHLSSEVDLILQQDHEVQHGRLTIARAVYLMKSHGHSAEMALKTAVEISKGCVSSESDIRTSVKLIKLERFAISNRTSIGARFT